MVLLSEASLSGAVAGIRHDQSLPGVIDQRARSIHGEISTPLQLMISARFHGRLPVHHGDQTTGSMLSSANHIRLILTAIVYLYFFIN
jgi:hypothetical protein